MIEKKASMPEYSQKITWTSRDRGENKNCPNVACKDTNVLVPKDIIHKQMLQWLEDKFTPGMPCLPSAHSVASSNQWFVKNKNDIIRVHWRWNMSHWFLHVTHKTFQPVAKYISYHNSVMIFPAFDAKEVTVVLSKLNSQLTRDCGVCCPHCGVDDGNMAILTSYCQQVACLHITTKTATKQITHVIRLEKLVSLTLESKPQWHWRSLARNIIGHTPFFAYPVIHTWHLKVCYNSVCSAVCLGST